jgi:CheY-like chemotaxis protein
MNRRDRALPRSDVADDEEMVRDFCVTVLEKNGYRVTAAADGKEAIKRACKNIPDVILLDVLMPGLDGFEVTRQLKKDPRTKNIPIILVTTLDGLENKLSGLEAGAEEYLSKPVKPLELLARVKSMLQLKQYRDQLVIRKISEGALLGVIQLQGILIIDILTFGLAILVLMFVAIPQPAQTVASQAKEGSSRRRTSGSSARTCLA